MLKYYCAKSDECSGEALKGFAILSWGLRRLQREGDVVTAFKGSVPGSLADKIPSCAAVRFDAVDHSVIDFIPHQAFSSWQAAVRAYEPPY